MIFIIFAKYHINFIVKTISAFSHYLGCSFFFNIIWKIVQITDGIKRWTQYRYDGDLLTDVIHADQEIVHYEYDQNQNQDLVREWDSEGRETLRCYDKEHNLLSEKERMGEGRWRETVYRYDSKGRRISVEDGMGNRNTH